MTENTDEVRPLLGDKASLMDSGPEFVFRCLFWYAMILAGLAIVAYLLVFVNSQIYDRGFPYNTILYIPHIRFDDFTQFYSKFHHFGTAQFWNAKTGLINYPASDAYVYLLFFKFFPRSAVAAALGYDATIATFSAMAVVIIIWSIRKHPLMVPMVAILALMFITSYPLMFLADRANLEGVSWIAVILGTWAFVRQLRYLAAVLFACAAALKLTPLVLIFLFIRKRDWKGVAAFVAAFLLIDALATVFIGPNVLQTLHALTNGVQTFKHSYVQGFSAGGIGVDHALFSVVKQGLFWICYIAGNTINLNQMIGAWYHLYCVGWLVGVAYLIWNMRNKPMLNCFFAIIITQLIAPPISFDYTLLYMYVPFALFLIYFLLGDVYSGRTRFPIWKVLAVLIPCAIAFTPQQNYLVEMDGIGFAGQIKALSLLVLLIFVIGHPMPCTIFGEYGANIDTGDPTHRKPVSDQMAAGIE